MSERLTPEHEAIAREYVAQHPDSPTAEFFSEIDALRARNAEIEALDTKYMEVNMQLTEELTATRELLDRCCDAPLKLELMTAERDRLRAELDAWQETFGCDSPHDTHVRTGTMLGKEQERANRLKKEVERLRAALVQAKAGLAKTIAQSGECTCFDCSQTRVALAAINAALEGKP